MTRSIRFTFISVLFLTLFCDGVIGAGPTVTNAARAGSIPGGKRWLLVVETSSVMQRMKAGTLDSLRELLESQMSGQLKPQDTIGVWVFDRELHTGKLPL